MKTNSLSLVIHAGPMFPPFRRRQNEKLGSLTQAHSPGGELMSLHTRDSSGLWPVWALALSSFFTHTENSLAWTCTRQKRRFVCCGKSMTWLEHRHADSCDSSWSLIWPTSTRRHQREYVSARRCLFWEVLLGLIWPTSARRQQREYLSARRCLSLEVWCILDMLLAKKDGPRLASWLDVCALLQGVVNWDLLRICNLEICYLPKLVHTLLLLFSWLISWRRSSGLYMSARLWKSHLLVNTFVAWDVLVSWFPNCSVLP